MEAEEFEEVPESVQPKPEPVPGHAGVFVRSMSGEERDRWEESIRDMVDEDDLKAGGEGGGGGGGSDKAARVATPKSHFWAALVIAAICHADGRPVFRTKSPGVLARSLNSKVLKALYGHAYKHNALGPEGEAAEKKDTGGSGDAMPGSGNSSDAPTESPTSAGSSAPSARGGSPSSRRSTTLSPGAKPAKTRGPRRSA